MLVHRLHGLPDAPGPTLVALHGGPAAAGSAAALARGLALQFHVVEPFQRTSSPDIRLTVAAHVADLHELLGGLLLRAPRPNSSAPILVGESWGAMLALAYAAAHPLDVAALVLVGCGTFDLDARAQLTSTREARIAKHLRRHPEEQANHSSDPIARALRLHNVTDNFDPLPEDAGRPGDADAPAPPPFDPVAFEQTWSDMLACQTAGRYPAAFAAIRIPVLMVHGQYDPHPGRATFDLLRRFMPQIQYVELDRCGHSPWIERHARAEFFRVVTDWIANPTG